MEFEVYCIKRGGWLKAAVLGAYDEILSTTSLVIGIAVSSGSREPILLAAAAGIAAEALSMEAGTMPPKINQILRHP